MNPEVNRKAGQGLSFSDGAARVDFGVGWTITKVRENTVDGVQRRYGCKSAYETYKRFARTNTRAPAREEVGCTPRGIQMRINIYERAHARRSSTARGKVLHHQNISDTFKTFFILKDFNDFNIHTVFYFLQKLKKNLSHRKLNVKSIDR